MTEQKQLRPLLLIAVEDNLDMAMSAAKKFHKRTGLTNVSLDDVKAAAYYGLLLAAHRYDEYCEEHGYNANDLSYFSVYCRKRINGEMVDLLRAQDWVSRTIRTRQKLIDSLQEQEQLRLSEEELASRLGLSVEQVRKAQAANETQPLSVSHDLSITEFDPAFFVEHVEDSSVEASILELAARVWDELSVESQSALAYRYFLGYTIGDTAAALGLSMTDGAALIHESSLHFYEQFREHFYPE